MQSSISTEYHDSSIFVLKMDEVTGEWIEMHNDEFHNLQSSLYTLGVINMKTRWAGHVTRAAGEKRNACSV
jgi:hypothetical protein